MPPPRAPAQTCALAVCRLPVVHERISGLREPRQEAHGKERVTRNGDGRMETLAHGAWRMSLPLLYPHLCISVAPR
jgi:hypothetical protein